MDTRCLFGIFVFGTNSSVIYRFLTDDLYEHLIQCFKKRGYKLSNDLAEDNQVRILYFFLNIHCFFEIIKGR
jgi:hypothetical protein